MEMSEVIAVAGPSGVGKTTISRMIATICGLEQTLILSSDDLHKWPRSHKKWLQYTHFDPAANFLSLGTEHINLLKRGKVVMRKKYDHGTGNFTPLQSVQPKPFIVTEGLHTLYSKEDATISDIKIYVETEPHLKDRWKIKRDISKRGYKLSDVVETINRRKIDEEKYITPQKKNADAIVMFVEREGKIKFTYALKNQRAEAIMHELNNLYNIHDEFINMSQKLANHFELTQNKGGNMSYKYRESMIITSSGSSFEDITPTDGFTHCTSNGVQVFSEQKRPSMEAMIHTQIKERTVLHTHPCYVLAALCSKEAFDIIDNLFGKEVAVVDYYCPGADLSNNFPDSSSTVFAKNHGLFVGASTFKECFERTLKINDMVKDFLLKGKKQRYLFPDACVLEKENLFLHGFISSLMQSLSLTPDYLSKKQVYNILNLDAEKYRKET
mgnify:CR=1 FL=1